MNSKRHPTKVHSQRPQSTSNDTQSRIIHHNSVELKTEPLALPRSLKRKKSSSSIIASGQSSSGANGRNYERVENKVPDASKSSVSSSSRQSSSRIFAAMGRPPLLEPDLLVRVSSKKDKDIAASHDLCGGRNDVDKADTQRNIPVDRHMFTGPLAVAERERMKREIETLRETLRETLHENKKQYKRQTKQLEESKAEANAAVMAMKEREIELVDVKTKCRKIEELLSTIENSVQCQICMDLPDKPFALSPCGHVLCLSCLQQWFRKAPPALDDMDADLDELTDPQYVLTRSKTCPSCRAVVKHRPVPIFMVKSVVTAFKKRKSQQASSPGSRHNTDYLLAEENPWKGIFASSEEEDDDDESPSESDSDDLGDWRQHSHAAQFETAVEDNASSESEMENEEDEDDAADVYGQRTHQRWAPPSVSVTDYQAGDDDVPNTVKLLQRGCSWDMLQKFDVSYSHESGIVVALRSLDYLYDGDDEDTDDIVMHRVFLGWNIALHPSDTDGTEYMQEILWQIKGVPERWEVTEAPGDPFAMDARRLVFVDEVEEFDTTDTEAWIDNEDL